MRHLPAVDLGQVFGGIAAVRDREVRHRRWIHGFDRGATGVVQGVVDHVIVVFGIDMNGRLRLLESQVMQGTKWLVRKPDHGMQIDEMSRPQVRMIDVVPPNLLPPPLGQ